MNYWLIKSEPDAFSIDDLAATDKEHWDGVRNYQARNFMQQMNKGDLLFFYHSSCKPAGIVGIAEVATEAYVDHTAQDPDSNYHDPRATTENPRWYMVDVALKQKFKKMISLAELKRQPDLEEMKLLQKGNRLSVMPVDPVHWQLICQMTANH